MSRPLLPMLPVSVPPVQGVFQAGLTLGACVGMAQAKQTQWDRVAFGHSGPLEAPRSPSQEGAAAPPQYPPPGPRLAQHVGIPQLCGVGHHQLLLSPSPSLVVGRLNRSAPNGSFAPQTCGLEPSTPIPGATFWSSALPPGLLSCPAAPRENWSMPTLSLTAAGRALAATMPWGPCCPPSPSPPAPPLELLSGAGEEYEFGVSFAPGQETLFLVRGQHS